MPTNELSWMPDIDPFTRYQLVDAVAVAWRQKVGRVEALPFAGGEIEPEDVDRANALGPYLAVHVMAQAYEVELDAVVVPFRRQRIVFDFASLRIDVADGALVHGVEPEFALIVEFQTEIACRRARFELFCGIFRELERLRIELGNEQLAEVGIPDVTVLIEQHVVRLGRRTPHIVFGHDGARGSFRGTRQRLQRIIPIADRAQVNGREVFGHLAVVLRLAGARLVKHPLRLEWGGPKGTSLPVG